MMTCRSNRLPPPDPSDLKSWIADAVYRIFHYEPCGQPASHLAHGRMPMCPEHAEKFRTSLRSADCTMNLRIGRGRTESEIAELVKPIAPTP